MVPGPGLTDAWCAVSGADASGRGTMTLQADSKTPSWVSAHAKQVAAVRGDRPRVAAMLDQSPVPILLLDDKRRYVDANGPALKALGLSPAELRRLRLDDLAPRYLLPQLEGGWRRLMANGSLVAHELAQPGGDSYLGLTSYAMANVLPGCHLLAFMPGQPSQNGASAAPVASQALTPREIEVLQLAAGGLNGPDIAEALVLTAATVRTHFTNIYRKLGVRDRAAAVAKAMRLGLIS